MIVARNDHARFRNNSTLENGIVIRVGASAQVTGETYVERRRTQDFVKTIQDQAHVHTILEFVALQDLFNFLAKFVSDGNSAIGNRFLNDTTGFTAEHKGGNSDSRVEHNDVLHLFFVRRSARTSFTQRATSCSVAVTPARSNSRCESRSNLRTRLASYARNVSRNSSLIVRPSAFATRSTCSASSGGKLMLKMRLVRAISA